MRLKSLSVVFGLFGIIVSGTIQPAQSQDKRAGTTGSGTSATVVSVAEPPLTTKIGANKLVMSVKEPSSTTGISGASRVILDAERRSRIAICARRFFGKNETHNMELEIFGPKELDGVPEYQIQITGPSEGLSQKRAGSWERIKFSLLVHQARPISKFIFFTPEAQIQKSPLNVSPPIARYQEMSHENIPMLTDFQQKFADALKLCIETREFEKEQ